MNFDDNKAFCVMPWLHLHVTTTGHFTLCCISNRRLVDDEGRPFHIRTHTLEEVWNSADLDAIRRQMINGQRVAPCDICYNYEDVAGSSTRKSLNEWLLKTHDRAERNITIIEDETAGKTPPLPGYVDIRLSNLCNLGCRMCSSDASSQIEKDEVHSRWSPYSGPVEVPGSNIGDSAERGRRSRPVEVVTAELQKLDDLYFIQLAGGEPTINDAQMQWLRKLAETGESRNIELSIWTNFTTANRQVFDVISSFRQVTLTLSIDGYGETYDYIRWPGRWQMIERNLVYLAKFRERIFLKMNCVVQAYNALDLPRILDWARKNKVEVMLHDVTPQEYLDFRVLSTDMRTNIRDTWAAYKNGLNDDEVVDRSILQALAKILAQTAEDFPEESRLVNLDMFVRFTNDLDRKRRQSVATSVPSVHSDVAKQLGTWKQDGRFT